MNVVERLCLSAFILWQCFILPWQRIAQEWQKQRRKKMTEYQLVMNNVKTQRQGSNIVVALKTEKGIPLQGKMIGINDEGFLVMSKKSSAVNANKPFEVVSVPITAISYVIHKDIEAPNE